jgi:hypothetical protein
LKLSEAETKALERILVEQLLELPVAQYETWRQNCGQLAKRSIRQAVADRAAAEQTAMEAIDISNGPDILSQQNLFTLAQWGLLGGACE